MHKLVLVRHGQSTWNQENRFTGWTDIDLTELGREEARLAGQALKDAELIFDVAYTSVLKRAIRTLWIVLDELDQMWIPIHNSWRLNERHYGALQGLSKSEMAAQFGEEQVLIWRRSYNVPPPLMEKEDSRRPHVDPRYGGCDIAGLPFTECLEDTVNRVLPYWHETIAPAMRAGKKPIVVAHGNTIRAMVKYFDNMTEADVIGLNIPTGIPMVYELDDDLKPLQRYYLGDPEAVARAAQAVAQQGKAQ